MQLFACTHSSSRWTPYLCPALTCCCSTSCGTTQRAAAVQTTLAKEQVSESHVGLWSPLQFPTHGKRIVEKASQRGTVEQKGCSLSWKAKVRAFCGIWCAARGSSPPRPKVQSGTRQKAPRPPPSIAVGRRDGFNFEKILCRIINRLIPLRF